jgi:lipopolysaccharide biosynthesis glycosyltransferase
MAEDWRKKPRKSAQKTKEEIEEKRTKKKTWKDKHHHVRISECTWCKYLNNLKV